jgi:hypothetical protein
MLWAGCDPTLGLYFCRLCALQLHARALMPQGNWLKGLQTKWRLFQAVLKADSQTEKAVPAEQSLIAEVGCDEVGLLLVAVRVAVLSNRLCQLPQVLPLTST